jgi:hypothetical protein
MRIMTVDDASAARDLVLTVGIARARPMARLRWRNKPLPALRLTDSGMDYSPAYASIFTLHVEWAVPMRSAWLRGPDPDSFYWCLYAPVIEGLGDLPPYIDRDYPMEESEVAADYKSLLRQAGIDKRAPGQAAERAAAVHLAFYGTPVVLNPYHATGSPKAAIDERLRERTGGTCSMTPGTEPLKNIIRPPTFW